jgi:hypothetical protein
MQGTLNAFLFIVLFVVVTKAISRSILILEFGQKWPLERRREHDEH